MPFITIDTNAKKKVEDLDLVELTDLVSIELGKPKDYIVAKINSNVNLCCGGTPSVCGALIEMKSIGFGGKTSRLAQVLTDFCVEKFGCEAPAVNIHFVDMPAANVAKGGRTFG